MEATVASRDLVIIGGGGHALVVAEAAGLVGHRVVGYFDDAERAVLGEGLPPGGVDRLGGLADIERVLGSAGAAGRASVIIAIGHAGTRRGLIDRLRAMGKGTGATVVHPSATVSMSARLGVGVFVGPRAVVHTRAEIGDHAIVNTGAIVEHECVVGENAHVAPGAVLGGRSRAEADSLVGIGARVMLGRMVGAGAVVGCGAVVVSDVGAGAVVMGVPARMRV